MKKLFTLFFLFFGLINFTQAQEILITENTQFSLLTCSPGPVAYEKFGHTGIRVYDESQSVDFVANWGIFDFEKENFYPLFVKGETYYWLDFQPTFSFLNSYRARSSSVTEQVLNLNDEQKQKLLDLILTNYKPENREYLYNFVFDNCATRPRDIINESLLPNMLETKHNFSEKSFRHLVTDYTGKFSWLQFGIDLVFGKDADEIATPFQTLFLPEELCKSYAVSFVVDENDAEIPLVAEKNILVEKQDVPEKTSLLTLPIVATSLVLLLGLLLMFFDYKRKKHSRWFDFILLIITGIAGIIIFYLMFFSIHPLVKNNFNLLWCNPLNLIFAVMIWIRSSQRTMIIIAMIQVVLYMLVLIVATMTIQSLNIAFLPLIGLMLVRALHYLKMKRNKA
ncbi:MAG TPA: DUF4105 domain-containing protein [Bacteroidales bacterium]|nr:DUF4105 domain-containing protein [Bacteroidales bacterium]